MRATHHYAAWLPFRPSVRRSEREARPDAIGDVRITESARQRVLGPPAGAVGGHNHAWLQRAKIGTHALDQWLVQRPIQVKAAEEPVHPRSAGERQRIPCDVDDAGVTTAGQNHKPTVADVDDHRLIVEDEWIGLPMVVVPGVLHGETRLVAGGAVHFAGDKHRIIEEKTWLAFFHNGEAGAMQCRATRGRNLERVAARNPYAAAIPEVGMNQHR